MSVTIHQHYRIFPFTETYKLWEITYYDDSSWMQDGNGPKRGEIKPSLRELISSLQNRGTFANIRTEEKAKQVVLALRDFCDTHFNYSIKKRAYNALDTFLGGNMSQSAKAIQKIKDELDSYHVNLEGEAVGFLRSHNYL